MPAPKTFVAALVTYATTLAAVGRQQILDEFVELFARVNAGEGTQLVNSSVNGKSFGFQVNMTVEEKFAAFGEAIREIDDVGATCTYADFSCLQR